jgi:predicted aspartyl protease
MYDRRDKPMGRFTAELLLANNIDMAMAQAGAISPDKVRHVRLAGVVDTGANYLVLPKTVADQLGVPAAGEAAVRYADRRTATRPMVGQVHLELLGRQGIYHALVEPDRTTALIGAIVLEDLDLLVDCTTQTLNPRDPNRFVAEVE